MNVSDVFSYCPCRQVKTVWPRFMIDAVRASNELVNLFPVHTSSWWPLVEDVMSSPSVAKITEALVQEAVTHGEYTYLSIDGTFRVCLSLLGQAKFTASQEERDAQPFSDQESFYRVISVRGRSGAVLALQPSRSESAEELAQVLRLALPQEALVQTRHLASDNPSAKLFAAMSQLLPHLEGLSLDPTHGAMRYEQATNGRKTRGSQVLRGLLAKFSSYDPAIRSNIWGDMFTGLEERPLLPQEQRLQQDIQTGGMSARRARGVLTKVENLKVWPTRIQYIEALAALAATIGTELTRKIYGTKITVAKILYQLASPDKAEWLFNNLRYRHFLPHNVRTLLPSGTTSNEALHAELNSHFRQVQTLHRATLQLKLNIFRLAKLLSHNAALYSPTARQIPSSHLLARRLAVPVWTPRAWKEWVDQQRQNGVVEPPLQAQRAQDKETIRKKTLKRPGSQKRSRKRTPFTLQRETGIHRAGVKRRRPASASDSQQTIRKLKR